MAADPINLIASELIVAVLHSEIAPIGALTKVKSSKVGGALVFSTANGEKVSEAQINQLLEACNNRIARAGETVAQLPELPAGAAEAIQAEYKKSASKDASLNMLESVFNKGLVDAPGGQQELRFLVGQPAVKATEAVKAAAEARKVAKPADKPAEQKINPNLLAKQEKMKGRGAAAEKKEAEGVFGNWGPRQAPPQRKAADVIFQEVIARELLPLLKQKLGAGGEAISAEGLVEELRARSMERLEEELVLFGNEMYTRGLSSVKNAGQPPLSQLL